MLEPILLGSFFANMFSQFVNRIEWLRALVDFAFPPLCIACGRYSEDENGICDHCRKKIDCFASPLCITCEHPLPQETDCERCGEESVPLFAYAQYAPPVKEIIAAFKYRGIMTPAEFFATGIAMQFASRITNLNADLLLPIPLHLARERSREYNQAAIFAEALAPKLGIRFETDRLSRTMRRKPQSRLRKSLRVKNIRGVFEVKRQPERELRVILVDDIVTTGATVGEAIRVLREAGYQVVGVIAAGHGL